MKGFSLLETVVAISILTLAVLGPLALAAFSLRSASLSENEIIAFNLAEEGMELVINKRDSNIFSNRDWLEGLTGSAGCHTANGCYIDAATGVFNGCSPPDCPKIKRNTSTGLYNYTTGSETIFTRTVFLENVVGNNDEKKVKVVVSWTERFASPSFTLEHHIFKKR